jgi:hypothetical protein
LYENTQAKFLKTKISGHFSHSKIKIFDFREFQLNLQHIKYSSQRVFDYTEEWRERALRNSGNHPSVG